MEQNPISIVVVLAGMAFLFLGMMQYMVTREKANGTERFKLIDQVSELKQENATLKIEKEELLELIEDYKKTVRKYHDFSSKLLTKYKALQTQKNAE